MDRVITYLNPLPGRVPGCVSLLMLYHLVRSLPGPASGGPADRGRQLIEDALAAVDAMGPRNRLEAALIIQQVALQCHAQEALLAAAEEAEPAPKARAQRHMMALQRRAEALGREVRLHRRELAKQDVVHAPPPKLLCDVAALEAVWRDKLAELPATAVRVAKLEIPPGFGGAAAEPEKEAVVPPAPPVEAAAVPEAPARVPLWQQAKRRYLDELTDAELKELVLAQHRGEDFPEPPERPAGEAVPEQPIVRLSEAEFRAMTKAERWERYGAWTETPE